MGNRADRRREAREAAKAQKRGAPLPPRSKDEVLSMMPEPFRSAYSGVWEEGYSAGYYAGGKEVLEYCYIGICIALHDVYGFGEQRCLRALQACDEKIQYALTHKELAAELREKTGFYIDWDDPAERIKGVKA